MEECEKALAKFLAPDPYSRSPEHEGRRIEPVDGGWQILNHDKYREKLSVEDRREYKRVKQAEYRTRQKESSKAKKRRLDESSRERRFTAALERGDEAAADAIVDRSEMQPDFPEPPMI